MNKSDTIAYYDAIGLSPKLICIDSTDSCEKIADEIRSSTSGNPNYNSFKIELFRNDDGFGTYDLFAQNNNSYDLWYEKDKKIDKQSIDSIASYIAANLPKTIKSPYEKYISSKTDDGTFIVKSFTDESYESVIDPKTVTNDILTDHILGQYVYANGLIEWHPINSTDTSDFDQFINMISAEDLRLFAKTCLKIIPDYIFTVPASNDSEKKPASDLADGGLKRHILNALTMLVKMTELNYARIKFTQHEIDMMIVAMLFHDFLKSGWQEDYEKNSNTRFDHPRLAAQAIRCVRDIIPANDLLFISNCIESHNGQFNTDPNNPDAPPLPIPDTECKYTIHLAVYLTSFSNISTNTHDVYVYKDQKIHTINKFIPLAEDEVKIISNVLALPSIDMEKAKSFNIHHNEDSVRVILANMMESKRATERQLKYLDLATSLLFY